MPSDHQITRRGREDEAGSPGSTEPLRHEMILASAGSGKTFALTDRYTQLLALGATPGQIVALTFTRKAAGEFFDGILNKLARASQEPDEARKLAARIGVPETSPRDFRRLLRGVIEAMPRLTLSTFDAFFARIVRSFPLELGLAGDFELLQEHAALIERRRVLLRLFRQSETGLDKNQRDFIEAFKRATFGLEEKSLAAKLDRFLNEHHETYLAAPDASLWGNAARIWPDGCPWLENDAGAPTGVIRAWALTATLGTKQRERWIDFLDTLETWAPGSALARPLNFVLGKALEAWDALGRGEAVLAFDRKRQELPPAVCAALRAVVAHVVGGEVRRRLEITSGIHAILDGYERVYQDAVRRAGRLTFADVQRLLQQQEEIPGTGRRDDGDEAQALLRAERRLLIDWRLDGHFQHWLLDEFQDTSPGQWSVLKNLIDEIVQDDSGRRSFFYVGDVKQAIYAWREGDARLFREIFRHYNAGGRRAIAERRLDRSYRSGPDILAMVNAVFGRPEAMLPLFPAAAVRRWSAEWRDHVSAHPALPGHSAWILAADEEDRLTATLRLLEAIDPIGRGLSAAVLTQTNDAAVSFAGHLRRAGLRAVAESDQHVCTDNPLTAGLLALLEAAAHPGDGLAWEHARMTPFPIPPSRDALTRTVLRSIHDDGFEATIEDWLNRIEPHLDAEDHFSRARGRQMAEAARLFDETGGRNVADFIDFMERHTVREGETTAVVRVMTIHKSKGLGFDLVVLPDLEGNKLASRRNGLAVQKSHDRRIEWVLELPPEPIRKADPALSQYVAEAEADACYDQLALLYVALTRARQGLYVVTEDPSESSSHNFPKLLQATLGDDLSSIKIGPAEHRGPWSAGNPQWHESAGPAPIPPDSFAREALGATPAADRVARLIPRAPSDSHSGFVNGASLFVSGRDSAAFGTQVHTLLALVDWWSPALREKWLAAAQASGASSGAIRCALDCLEAPENAEVFDRPCDGLVEVWCERSFEMVAGAAWIAGKFDRVIVERANGGAVRRVHVYDFKTDNPGHTPSDWLATARRHASQMAAYRTAAAKLAGCALERVTASIVLVNAPSPGGRRSAPIPVEKLQR